MINKRSFMCRIYLVSFHWGDNAIPSEILISSDFLMLEVNILVGKFARARGFDQSNSPEGRESDPKIYPLGPGFDRFLTICPGEW